MDQLEKLRAPHLEEEVPLKEPEICKIEDPHEHIDGFHVGITDRSMIDNSE